MDRPILNTEADQELSPAGQLVIGMGLVGAAAADLRSKVNLDHLHHHCLAALNEWKIKRALIEQRGDGDKPEMAQAEMAISRADRGMKLAAAGIAFIKVYEEVNR